MGMIARSTLFTPGSEPRMIPKALGTEADAVTLDLEDAVAPDAKPAAREEVGRVLREVDRPETPLIGVRINELGKGGRADLDAIIDGSNDPDYLVLPMAETRADPEGLMAELRERGSSVDVKATIETAVGVLHAPEVAAVDGVVGLGFGREDLSADVGTTHVVGDELLYARQKIVLSAAAAGKAASDTVYIDIGDLEGLRAEAETAKRMGYAGKSAIHPDQVTVINEVFTPSEEEVARAREIVEGFEAAGKGAVQIAGQMIDPPVYERARRTLERAEAAGIE